MIKLPTISLQKKLVLSCSSAIFLTFCLFSFLEYNSVSKWMLNREKLAVKRTMMDVTMYYKDLQANDIRQSKDLLRSLNDKDQLIRIYDQNGNVLVSDKNGLFPVLEPRPVNTSEIGKLSTEENDTIVFRSPLKADGFQGTIEVVRELNSYEKMMDHLFFVMISFGVAAILLSALIGFFLARQLLKPVRDLATAMKRIKANGFQERVKVSKRKDELTDFSNLFNEMMDELEQSFLQQKQFIEDASHELRTPVSILEGHLSLLNRWGKKDPAILDESLEACLQEVSRLKKLTLNLLDLTRAENSRMILSQEFIDVNQILDQLVKNFEVIHPDFQFELMVAQNMKPISMIEQHLQQVLIILMDNAVKYSDEHKYIKVSARQNEKETILSVEDQGIGIPQKYVNEVFNRFFRVDKARNRENGGTGLGLSIAKRIIEKYQGYIEIESQLGIGTTITIVLPLK